MIKVDVDLTGIENLSGNFRLFITDFVNLSSNSNEKFIGTIKKVMSTKIRKNYNIAKSYPTGSEWRKTKAELVGKPMSDVKKKLEKFGYDTIRFSGGDWLPINHSSNWKATGTLEKRFFRDVPAEKTKTVKTGDGISLESSMDVSDLKPTEYGGQWVPYPVAIADMMMDISDDNASIMYVSEHGKDEISDILKTELEFILKNKYSSSKVGEKG